MTSDILSIIAQFGFPAVLCIVILWYCYKMLENRQAESKSFTDALNQNSLVLSELKLMIQQLQTQLSEYHKEK